MNKQYRCTRAFEVDEVDGDGFRTGNFQFVEEGSIWEEDQTAINVTGADIHLEYAGTGNVDFPWIEISKEDLRKDFEEIRRGEQL